MSKNDFVTTIVPCADIGLPPVVVRKRGDGWVELRQGPHFEVFSPEEAEKLGAELTAKAPRGLVKLRYLWQDFWAGVRGQPAPKRVVTFGRDDAAD